MAISEFFTETIMNSGLNRVLSVVALGLVGAGIEYYNEKDGKKKAAAATVGFVTYGDIGVFGIMSYIAYKDFNMYEFGITALCGVAGAYLMYNFIARLQQSEIKKSVRDGQSIIWGLCLGSVLGGVFLMSRMNQEALSR